MYTEFFGLQALPFNLTPDPGFLFLPPKHREAITGLSYAIVERKGFVVLTGDAGTGKTTILNSVLSRLPETHVLTSVILNPTLTPAEFLENVLLDFGIPDIPASKAQRLWVLQAFLARAHQEDQIVAVIIDEAHKLNFDVLEEIRLLGNYEFGPDKFLQILLLGQTELDHILNQYELRQLKQRIALRLYIDPLSPAQVPEYITFRWGAAGGVGAHPFDAEAMTGILRWSRGVPRLVNAICDTSLLMAYGEGIHVVGVNFVRAVARTDVHRSRLDWNVFSQSVPSIPPLKPMPGFRVYFPMGDPERISPFSAGWPASLDFSTNRQPKMTENTTAG
jgi:general secretion pathway protein A